MDDCQHYPELLLTLIEEPTPGAPLLRQTGQIMCRRCKVAIPARQISTNTPEWRKRLWEEWAALMERESAAKQKRLESQDPTVAAMARDAELWVAFKNAGRIPFSFDAGVPAARKLGENVRYWMEVTKIVERHLRGPLTPQRLNDLFVSMRKATKAFTLNAQIMLPPADADGEERP